MSALPSSLILSLSAAPAGAGVLNAAAGVAASVGGRARSTGSSGRAAPADRRAHRGGVRDRSRLPFLHGDRRVGRLPARADRDPVGYRYAAAAVRGDDPPAGGEPSTKTADHSDRILARRTYACPGARTDASDRGGRQDVARVAHRHHRRPACAAATEQHAGLVLASADVDDKPTRSPASVRCSIRSATCAVWS